MYQAIQSNKNSFQLTFFSPFNHGGAYLKFNDSKQYYPQSKEKTTGVFFHTKGKLLKWII